jgi:isopenicillin N synthase-like dioxygenase
MLYKNLKENLFAVIEYPESVKHAVIETMQHWEQFCKLPQEVKDLFMYPDHQRFDAGYKRREKDKGREDKEYFHFSACNHVFVSDYPEAKIAYETRITVQHFFHAAANLHYKVSNTMIRNIVPELEESSSGRLKGLREDLFPSISIQNIRFLHYMPEDDAVIVAKEHYDRSGFTLHLYESGPGLEILPLSEKGKKVEDMQWIEIPMKENQTIMFTGYQMSQMSGTDLKHTWHRVRPKESVNRERFSAVMFNALSTIPSYDVNESSQKLVPGYGY